jgi:adenylate kinase
MLGEIERPLSVVLELQVPDGVARERMRKRAREEARADDTPEAIEKRIALYHELSRPLGEHYLATGKLVGIHGDRTVNEVWVEIQDALETTRTRAA